MPRKKARNRRNKRRHVLDVKASSSQVRKHRVRMAVSSLLTIAVILGAVYGLWRGGYWAVQHFVYKNKNLSIEHFEVRTDGVIDRRHLRRWSGVQPGDNLFAVDLHDIKQNLENHGMIHSVSLERSLPDTLKMQVFERVPMALIQVAERDANNRYRYRKYAMDAEANLMNLNTNIVRRESALAWNQLPWLATTNYNGVFSAPDLRNPQIKAALRFIEMFEKAEIRNEIKIEKVDIDDKYILRVSVSNGATVDILSGDFERQLARWKVIHTTLSRRNESYSWMDLSVTNHVPVRRVPLDSPQRTNLIRQF